MERIEELQEPEKEHGHPQEEPQPVRELLDVDAHDDLSFMDAGALRASHAMSSLYMRSSVASRESCAPQPRVACHATPGLSVKQPVMTGVRRPSRKAQPIDAALLETFLTVIEAGSLRAAAQRMKT